MQQIATNQEDETHTNGSFKQTVECFTTDYNTLMQILKSINSVNEGDSTITLYSEGLSFRNIDSYHVSLCDMGLNNSIFEKYSIEREIKIGFNVVEFLNIVKTLDKKRSITIEILNEKIKISQRDLEMELKTIDPRSDDYPLPKIPYDTEIITNLKTFKNLIDRASSVGDYITIESIDNTIKLSATGDKGSFKQEITNNHESLQINSKNDSNTTYSIEYIKEFLKSIPKDGNVIFEYSQMKPCRITTSLNNIGRIQYYLAPRVEN